MGPSQGTGHPLLKYPALDPGTIEENSMNNENLPYFDDALQVELYVLLKTT